MTTNRPVLIAGGGIGGLTAAIALDRKAIDAQILERSTFSEESGAGIQLGPNATRILRRLGVLDALESQTSGPKPSGFSTAGTGRSSPRSRSARSRRRATAHLTSPLTGPICTKRCETLLATARTSRSLLTSRLPMSATRMGQSPVPTARARLGSTLVGADGLWSTVRGWVAPGLAPSFTGATAFRSLIPRDALPEPFSAPIVGLWLGPRTHLVHYPVRGGDAVNVVAVTEQGEREEGWNRSAEKETVLGNFARWNDAPLSLLDAAPSWRAWSLFGLPALPQWSRGSAVLLGDAAHPVLPYLAQGAGLAIEDAAELASILGQTPSQPSHAFQAYETVRRPRATRVQQASRRLGRAYHVGDGILGEVFRNTRNTILGLRSETATLRGFDWLYGHGG
ncbi:hypothetical protein AUC70_08130 [Methyloceanibacter stevinii]|uniref:FAD-binding domain-containing protein n=1 Tax=Methyloceanibacter stevinii TaxID=1774970 RepID=A0A1E3VM35_9HYPH|nr:FAD-dependent monooxygenase [Methyloceanibacter stevinii]ODR94590.1 hypothetical protein AUC70_08130 [Methyloceanibacter stevinii]